MFTLARSVRMGFLAPFIVLAMIGFTGCSNPAPEPGVSNSISKGSEAAIRTSLRTDAANMVNSLSALNATNGEYPAGDNVQNLSALVAEVRLNPGNYVSNYAPSADRSAFTLTLANDTLTTDKSIQYSSNTGLYR